MSGERDPFHAHIYYDMPERQVAARFHAELCAGKAQKQSGVVGKNALGRGFVEPDRILPLAAFLAFLGESALGVDGVDKLRLR